MDTSQHHVQVEISASAFANNIRALRRRARPAKFCVVMKADAYGHGLSQLAPVAAVAGADYIGICTNPEAVELRRQLSGMPLLRLRGALPEELDESVARLDIEEQVGSLQVAEYLNQKGHARGKRVRVHLKVDTGMGRSGFFPDDIEAARLVCRMPGLRIVGVMTHFASADASALDSARAQLEAFDDFVATLAEDLPADAMLHTHNSAATIRLPERRHDLVRVGAACYGVRTSRDFENPPDLEPVMSVKSRIMEIRDMPAGASVGYGGLFTTERPTRVATIPVGFGEGYPRSLFNKGIVLIGGHRCPVIGRVSLNVTTIDITDLPDGAAIGDEVVLVGAQGGQCVTFEELADLFASVHTEINLMAGQMNQRTLLPLAAERSAGSSRS